MNINSTEAEIEQHNEAANCPTDFQKTGVFKQNEPFDETEFYETELGPLIKQVFDKCQEKGIPMFCLVNPAMNETGVASHSSRVFRDHSLANGNAQVLLLSELCRPENHALMQDVYMHMFGPQIRVIQMLDKIQGAGGEPQ